MNALYKLVLPTGFLLTLVYGSYYEEVNQISILDQILMFIPVYAFSRGILVNEILSYRKRVCMNIREFLDCSFISYSDQEICCSEYLV